MAKELSRDVYPRLPTLLTPMLRAIDFQKTLVDLFALGNTDFSLAWTLLPKLDIWAAMAILKNMFVLIRENGLLTTEENQAVLVGYHKHVEKVMKEAPGMEGRLQWTCATLTNLHNVSCFFCTVSSISAHISRFPERERPERDAQTPKSHP